MLLFPLVTSRHVFVSSPFDNFRMECPKRAAAVELSIRMVESVGAKRQDVVFDMTCEGINELFPWVNIPFGISEMEREDCYYSSMLDPILDETSDFSCKHREYLAGITRLTDTRVQLMCCRLRSRDEYNCQETIFNKPVGLTKSTVIEKAARLSALPSTTATLSTTASPRRKSSNTPSSKRANGTSKKRVAETSTMPLHQSKLFELESSSGNSVLESNEHVDKADSKLTKKFRPSGRSSPSLSSKVKNHTLADSMSIKANSVTKSKRVPSNAVVHSEDALVEVAQEHILNQRKDDYPTNVDQIIRKIQQFPSKSAENLFKDVVANLVNTTISTGTIAVDQQQTKAFARSSSIPVSTAVPNIHSNVNFVEEAMERVGNKAEEPFSEIKAQENFTNEITVNDLSLITFHDEEFPKASEKKFAVPAKFKVSKTDLPLKTGVSMDDFVFLRSINSDGHRRAPLRTHRPHVEIWSSDEDEMNGGDSSLEHTTVKTIRRRKTVKLRKKVTRAHRLPTTNKPNELSTDYATTLLEEKSSDATIEPITREVPRLQVTTAASLRRDLPSSRKVVESMTRKVDNAHFVDEETVVSPFEDEGQVLSGMHHNSGIHPNLYLRGDEDIEEVIMKLSAAASNIRRAPVRNSNPKEQKSDKNAGESDDRSEKLVKEKGTVKAKDGNKTYTPKRIPPIPMPGEMAIFENQHMEDVIVEDITKVGTGKETEAQDNNRKGSSEEDELAVLTFCTKDVAVRDNRNMVVACGGEHDVWLPNRCPQGADCFVAQDSTYRLCCPVSTG
ncbi:unnamed protein product [Angiostrongylus costaricensis]|uniref:CBM1 domain-containing protein n=1 Tax=Angiostrongylus costaricensis TaxID=334426 RepID=A0A158PL80_ANGCS|nr:unnamed protein product [Angiostrongylus costaricensis]